MDFLSSILDGVTATEKRKSTGDPGPSKAKKPNTSRTLHITAKNTLRANEPIVLQGRKLPPGATSVSGEPPLTKPDLECIAASMTHARPARPAANAHKTAESDKSKPKVYSTEYLEPSAEAAGGIGDAFAKLEAARKTAQKKAYDPGHGPVITTAAECKQACAQLSQCKEMAVDLEGVNFGRDGRISLVQIATEDNVYLFDIFVGGSGMFDSGLRDILESDKVLKVLHDSRTDSDALWHCNQVKLVNVFDTQIAYSIYQRQTGRNTPLPIGLNTLLRLFCENKNESKDEAKKGMMEDELYWERRPMTSTMLQYSREDVLYLLQAYRRLRAVILMDNYRFTLKQSALYVGMYRDQPNFVRQKTEYPRYGFPDWDVDAENAAKRRGPRRNPPSADHTPLAFAAPLVPDDGATEAPHAK